MKQQKTFLVDILFVLALFGVFTFSALMLVSVGAEVYRHTVSDMSANYETRTSISYITEKIRQNDFAHNPDYIKVSELSGNQALTLTQTSDGEIFYTHLYFYDGYLKELFTKSGSYLGDNTLAAGQNIMKLSDFQLVQTSANLFSIRLTTPSGESHTLFVSTHCTP